MIFDLIWPLVSLHDLKRSWGLKIQNYTGYFWKIEAYL